MLEHGGQLTDPGGPGLAGLGLGGGHVLEDQGSGVAAAARRERADHRDRRGQAAPALLGLSRINPSIGQPSAHTKPFLARSDLR